MKLESIWAENANPYYNPDSPNGDAGGNYFQPTGGCLFWHHNKPLIVECCDDFCGDFGTSYDVEVTFGKFTWHLCWGSMKDDSHMSHRELCRILDSMDGVLKTNSIMLIDTVMRAVYDVAWKTLPERAL